MRVILVTGFFDPGARDGKLDYFKRLDVQLRTNDTRLHVLNLNTRRIPPPLNGESSPILLEKSHWLPIDRLVKPLEFHPDVVHGASIDAACWNRSLSRERIRVLLYREHIRHVLQRVQPVLVIAWHQFFGSHYGMRSLMHECGVPWLFAEYGPLPGTILFDREGQGAESPIVTRNDAFVASPIDNTDLDRATAFVKKVRDEKRTRKPQTAPGQVHKALASSSRAGRPVVFYAGQYDCRTGMVPRSLPQAEQTSPVYSSTLDALSHLTELAERNDWTILFKPHPLAAPVTNNTGTIAAPDRVVNVPGANLFECLEAADVVTTIVSQVSYMSLIWERPCVMLGRSYLTGKGCTAQPETRNAVEFAVRSAIDLGFTAEARSAWIRHVAQLLKYAVFEFDTDFSAPGLRGVDDAAGSLATVCATPDAAPFQDASTNDVTGNMHAAARMRRLYAILSCV